VATTSALLNINTAVAVTTTLMTDLSFPQNQQRNEHSTISSPTEGRYTNLSDAITILKLITCIAGNIAMKKIRKHVSSAGVHRSEMTRNTISMIVPMTPARTIVFDSENGWGKA
jgi:hypothetical protein